jgi:type II secretory pathway pseudopilin PulG
MGESRRIGPLANLFTFFIALLLVLLLAGAIVPAYNRVRDKALEAQAKVNLHNIQLAVERYAVDHGGEYPAYLIGGEAKCARRVTITALVDPADQPGTYRLRDGQTGEATGEEVTEYPHGLPVKSDPDRPVLSDEPPGFDDIADCDIVHVSDPLLREGYIDAYPRNPFVRDGGSVHRMQENLPTSITGNDPLRNACAEGALAGTRFGPYCTTMGQVLCDPRYPQWNYADPATGTVEPRDSWVIVEYRMWDMWLDPHSREPYLMYSPGQFFYKSMGDIVITDDKHAGADAPLLPVKVDDYMLGVYGGLRTKGKDILGEEMQVHGWIRDPGTQESRTVEFRPWTRSQCGVDQRQGSPYGSIGMCGDSIKQVNYGNPNGNSDAIVLVLVAGEDLR